MVLSMASYLDHDIVIEVDMKVVASLDQDTLIGLVMNCNFVQDTFNVLTRPAPNLVQDTLIGCVMDLYLDQDTVRGL